MSAKKDIVKTDLVLGVSKKGKEYFVLNISVYFPTTDSYVEFKQVFLNAFEGNALGLLGVDKTKLERVAVDSTPED